MYTNTGRDGFFAERMRQDATLRKLEVIGQAAKKLSEETKSRRPEVPWKQIAGMRDKVIHDYFGVNLEILWAAVERALPKLEQAIQRYFNSRSPVRAVSGSITRGRKPLVPQRARLEEPPPPPSTSLDPCRPGRSQRLRPWLPAEARVNLSARAASAPRTN
jgi:uncharacterized protein with HEPN domain